MKEKMIETRKLKKKFKAKKKEGRVRKRDGVFYVLHNDTIFRAMRYPANRPEHGNVY